MNIYAISDLHLSFGTNKPMNIFGEHWENYEDRIRENWNKLVKDDDLVIMPGDFSWATYIEDSKLDFEYINNLPGKKLFLKGNHDYWWTTISKMRKFTKENSYENIDFIFNNSYEFNGISFCGTRGWCKTNNSEYDDDKILNREYQRLELSLKNATTDNIYVMLHFPPTEAMIEIMKRYKVKKCIYGHLHGKLNNIQNKYIQNGIEYILVSADQVNFDLVKID